MIIFTNKIKGLFEKGIEYFFDINFASLIAFDVASIILLDPITSVAENPAIDANKPFVYASSRV